MSAALVNIIGVAGEPLEYTYTEGDSTEVLKNDLLRGFGNGILKYNGRGYARPTLVAGQYEYHVTAPAGGQPMLAAGIQPADVENEATWNAIVNGGVAKDPATRLWRLDVFDIEAAKARNVVIKCGVYRSNGVLVRFSDISERDTSSEQVYVVTSAHGLLDWDEHEAEYGLIGDLDIKTHTGVQVPWLEVIKSKESNGRLDRDFVLISVTCPVNVVPYQVALPDSLLTETVMNIAKLGESEFEVIKGVIVAENEVIARVNTHFPSGSSGLGLLNNRGEVVAIVKSTSDRYEGIELGGDRYSTKDLGHLFVNSLVDSRHEPVHGKVVPMRVVNQDLRSSSTNTEELCRFTSLNSHIITSSTGKKRRGRRGSRSTAKHPQSVWIRDGVEVKVDIKLEADEVQSSF